MRTAKCNKCGKTFYPAPYHIYCERGKYYCSWTCYNHRKDKTTEVKTCENN